MDGVGDASALEAAPSAVSHSPAAAPAEDEGPRVRFEGAESWDFNVLMLSKDCACRPCRLRRARALCASLAFRPERAACRSAAHARPCRSA